MIKFAILLISSLITFNSTFYNVNEITVTSNLPKSIKSNTTYKVELTINKGKVKGFAKLEQDLPEGFTATSIDSKGGSFKFENQKIKIIWMSLPSSEEFKITYDLKVANIEKGKKVIPGKLYFLAGAAKQVSEFDLDEIDVK